MYFRIRWPIYTSGHHADSMGAWDTTKALVIHWIKAHSGGLFFRPAIRRPGAPNMPDQDYSILIATLSSLIYQPIGLPS